LKSIFRREMFSNLLILALQQEGRERELMAEWLTPRALCHEMGKVVNLGECSVNSC